MTHLTLSLACDASPVSIGLVIFHTYPGGKRKGPYNNWTLD